jgi:SAM-dependent methyltransferase
VGGVAARLARLEPVLACPRCAGSVKVGSDAVTCAGCGTRYPIRNGKIYFVESQRTADPLDAVKAMLKRRFGSLYQSIGVDVIAPTYPFRYRRWVRRYLDPAKQIVVDIGCGSARVEPDAFGIDMMDYDAVDVVCDLGRLPFKAASVDAFVSRSVLEHVPDPAGVIQKIHAATKPGGLGLHLIPFLFPFHASPHDFQRYTHRGLDVLFSGWTTLTQSNATGPVTLALVMAIEFFSIVLSLGSERVKPYVYLGLCGLLFPLKYLDAPFIGRRAFLPLAPTIVTVVRKPETSHS